MRTGFVAAPVDSEGLSRIWRQPVPFMGVFGQAGAVEMKRPLPAGVLAGCRLCSLKARLVVGSGPMPTDLTGSQRAC